MSRFRHASEFRWAFLTGALAVALVKPGAAFAKELVLVAESTLRSAVSTTSAPEAKKPVLSWETGAGRSYIIPGLEIVTFLVLLNQYDRHFSEPEDAYRSGTHSFWNNLTDTKWVIDSDPFSTNQFLHPYQGSIYFGLARSTGLNFWESFLYSAAGSFLWEMAGETDPPSINDQITTPIGGSFLGEPLFRMASLLLETGDGSKPGFWRELGAAVISPPTGVNRLVFGDRFDPVFPSHHPAVFMRLQLGYSLSTSLTGQGDTQNFQPHEATADFAIAYGLPGKPGYHYTRPFDYFHFQFTADTANIFENIMVRGLLIGTDYAWGDAYRGVWGLYGSYDYISPQTFRVSSSALSLGTTAQWGRSPTMTLQGSALGGVGYGAAGTIYGSGDRDYHYGLTPQGLLALRLILGNRANFDVTLRGYYVSGTFSTENRGSETIFRGETAFTLRVYKSHAIGLKYIASTRESHYPDIDDQHQAVGTASIAYTYLSDTGFGTVKWR